jgi:hypothetical protein
VTGTCGGGTAWWIPAGGVLFGFLLAIAWDLVKFRRERGARQRAAIVGLREELVANRERAGSNATMLAVDEREYQPENKTMINPLMSLETGAWALARLNLPKGLAEDTDLVQRLQTIDHIATDVNTTIASRETFKIQTVQAPRAPEGLQGYAKILTYRQQDLIQRIEEILPDLARFTG